MLGTALTRLVQKVGLLISNVTTYLTQKLSKLRGVLIALKIQFAELSNLLNQFVQVVQKLKVLLVQFIILVQSIKLELINVVRKVLQTGQQLATTVLQIPQAAKQAWKKNK